MLQDVPVVPWMLLRKTVDKCGIKALFTSVQDWEYEVVLDVSSQKFLLRFSDNWGSIDRFEILAVKWFIYDLSLNLVSSLKLLVENLMY